ncbi:uncharacterized protein CIMG_13445 [Coccidioides immitis RS]|uniref:Uncharacterized protein n=1 Tax=Coccidioides immitis (strain RS) TaxID=246410 RepID=A0A0D8JXZ7_COCIM|nr:uncharacterized protein CIMG_13445 [Coccidioides immitis RS]KJF61128.1 hypothetical protein CIMG_13445 [Coccidioides immitis RS]
MASKSAAPPKERTKSQFAAAEAASSGNVKSQGQGSRIYRDRWEGYQRMKKSHMEWPVFDDMCFFSFYAQNFALGLNFTKML